MAQTFLSNNLAAPHHRPALWSLAASLILLVIVTIFYVRSAPADMTSGDALPSSQQQELVAKLNSAGEISISREEMGVTLDALSRSKASMSSEQKQEIINQLQAQ